MKKLVSCAAILASLSIAGVAMADEPTAPPTDQSQASVRRGVITLPPMILTGHPQRPLAAVQVSRMQPALTIAEVRVQLVERIENAIYSTLF